MPELSKLCSVCKEYYKYEYDDGCIIECIYQYTYCKKYNKVILGEICDYCCLEIFGDNDD